MDASWSELRISPKPVLAALLGLYPLLYVLGEMLGLSRDQLDSVQPSRWLDWWG